MVDIDDAILATSTVTPSKLSLGEGTNATPKLAVLTIAIWFLGSFAVRWIISVSVGGTSIYGPLATPIVLLI